MKRDHRFEALRKTSEQDWFPYKGIGPRSYYEVDPDGVMRQFTGVAELRAAIVRAKAGDVALLAVWTGRYRSDIFFVEDIEALEEADV